MSVAYAVVIPGRCRVAVPSDAVYARRRLLAGLCVVFVAVSLWLGAATVLANRGGAPASTPAVRPAPAVATAGASAAGTAGYVVQPGDTLWSIASAHRGHRSQSSYVDALVSANGGTALEVGQLLSLP